APDDELARLESLEISRFQLPGGPLRSVDRDQHPSAGPHDPRHFLDPGNLQRRVEVREDRYRIDEVELGIRIREIRLERVDREVGKAEMLAAPLDQQRVVVTPVQ